MKPRSNPFLRSAALAAITLATSAASAFAANGWWNTTDGNWTDVANWWDTVGGTALVGAVPTTAQTATFNGTGVNGNQTVYLNGNQAAASLTFANTGTTTLLGGVSGTPANNTLTLSGGITTSTGAGVVTIGDSAASPTAKVDLLLSSNQSFTTATGTTLTLANGVSASSVGLKTITLNGAGTTNFNGVIADGSGSVGVTVSTVAQTINFNQSNTFTGAFSTGTITSGTIGIGANDALGLGVINTNTSNQSTYAHTFSVNGNYTLNNSAINFGRATHTFSGTGSLTLTNKLTTHVSGTNLTNNLGGSLNLGAVDISSTSANATLTLAGTGNTNVSGVIANGNSSTASNLTINNTGLTTLANNNTFAGALTLGAGSNVILGGSNLFSGAITLGTGSTLKLAHADAVPGTTTGFTAPTGSTSTLWLANDAAINNLKINSANGNTIIARTIVDRATAGAAVDHSIAFVSTRGNYIFQKGSMVTSGTPLITASGNTTFGSGTNINAASIFNPLGVNLSFGNMTAATTGATCNNGLVLDGNSTGNKVTGVISNGGSSVAALTPTITATSGQQTVTVSDATNISTGALLNGYAGIPDGTMVTAVSGTTLTLSQVTTAGMAAATGSITSRVNTTNLIKAGPSTWALSGANSYSGSTTVQGGTLNLDFSATGAPTSNILYNNYTGSATRPTLTVAGGNLQLTGKASTANTQNLNVLSALAGGYSSKVTVNGGASGGTALLQISGLTLNTSGGSMVDFNIGTGGTINNSGATANSFVGWSATVNGGTDFAYYNGSKNIVTAVTGGNGGSTGYAALTASIGGTDTSFYDLTGGLTRTTATNFAYNGLKITSSGNNQVLDLNGGSFFTRNANRSTILYSGGGNNNYTIQGGTLQPTASGNGDLTLSSAAGTTLNVSAAISDNSTRVLILTKAGAGTLAVIGAKSFTGRLYVLDGTYSFDNLADAGVASGLGQSTNVNTNLFISGATVKYTGSEAAPTTNRLFTIGTNGAAIDASGTNALTWAPTGALGYAANQNQYLTLTGDNTGANTFGGGAGVLADSGGTTTLTKSGAGKWVLAGANTYTGGTNINEGTLGVTGTETAGTSGPLGKSGDIVFGGGTLQYSASNTADYSKRLLRSTSAIRIDTNGQAVAFASTIDNTNTGGLTKSGTGTLTLSGVNSYSGVTSVTAGSLVINGNQSGATGAVTVGGAGASNTPTLGGVGTIGGATTIAAAGGGAVGTHAPGVIGVNNGVGTQSFSSTLAYGAGSIFEWNLQAASSTDPGVVADALTGSYDKVVAAGAVTGSAAVFKIVLGGNAFTDAFWSTNKTWTDIFSGAGTPSNLASIFTSFSGTNVNTDGTVTGNSGYFTFNGTSTLTWSAVPEPTSALAGLLITAGLLRRRRERKF